MIGYPIVSATYLTNHYNVDSYLVITFYIFILFLSVNIVDTFIIDFFLFSYFTVNFIMVKGSIKEDYQDFKYHLKNGSKGLIISVIISFVCGLIIVCLNYNKLIY